jgi:peptide/nickel transport system substrate-binding protein
MKKAGLLATFLTGALLAAPAFAADLKIGLAEDPDMLDPAQSRTFVGRIVYTAMCDKLVDVTPNLEIVPQLATEWAWSEGGKVLTMKLRPGVKFHDGTSMDAEAVVATIKRNQTMPESRRKSEVSSIASVEATGPLEVKFTLKQPDATLLAQLSDRAGMIVSPKAAAELGANFSSKPVCAGPFEFVERVQQDRIVLKKFADYWNKDNIHFDKVTYLPIVDATVRLANLRAGDLDMIERMSPTDAAIVKKDAKLGLAQVVNLGFLSIYVNVGHGPRAETPLGKDKRVRQAFSLALDREALNQIVYEGTAPAGNQPVAPTSPWYNAKIPVPARDVAKAKALLKAAGHEKVEVEMLVSNSPIVVQMMEAVQAMVAEAGFDVKLKTMEFATLLNEETAGNFQAARTDWSGRVDPDGNIHQFVTCKGGLNEVKYCNPKVDELLDAARASVDPKVRKEKYDAAAVILDDDLPYIYLAHQSWLWGFDKKVTGFVPSPDGMIRLTGMAKAK